MLLQLYLVLFAFAVAATASWAILERRIPIAASMATGAWIYVALIDEVTVANGSLCCAPPTYEPGLIQWLGGGMGIISLGALALYIAGAYPPGDEAQSAQGQTQDEPGGQGLFGADSTAPSWGNDQPQSEQRSQE